MVGVVLSISLLTVVGCGETPLLQPQVSEKAPELHSQTDHDSDAVAAAPGVTLVVADDGPPSFPVSSDSPPIIKKAVEPTPEQVASWTHEGYEPLQWLSCIESKSLGFVSHLAATADGRKFITAGTKVAIWSVGVDVPEYVYLESAGGQEIKSLAVSPDGKWLAVGDNGGTLSIGKVSDYKPLKPKKLYATGIVQIAFSPDSREFATISYDKDIKIWNVETLEQKNRFDVDTNGLKRIEYIAPGQLVAAGETTSRWNVATGKLEAQLSPGRYNFAMARSTDGRRFVCGEKDGLQFWNIESGQRELFLHAGFATDERIAFPTNGKHLTTANSTAIRIWEIESDRLVQVIDSFGWPITGLAWLKEPNVMVVASLDGRLRLWGTSTDAKKAGLQPVQAAVAEPERSSHDPATSAQLIQMIDLRTFPRLSGEVTTNDEFGISYTAEVSVDEAALFYRFQLGRAGWDEVSGAVATPGAIQFQKDGFQIATSFYAQSPSTIYISVSFLGNYDLRWAPKFDGAPVEIVFENNSVVMYRTKADLIQIETNLLRKMHNDGWVACSRLHAAQREQEEQRNLEFIRGGASLHVGISRFPADPTQYMVQYSRFLESKSIPIPKDSGFIEFDGSTKPSLVATTSMDLNLAREFYDNEMAKQGWLIREHGRSVKDEGNWLTYVRGQQDLTIGLVRLDPTKTLVRVGDDLEKWSWQLAKPKTLDAADTVAVGIETADFPILNQSKTAKYDSVGKSFEIEMGSMPLLKVAELYSKELQSIGWKSDGAGIQSDDYVFVTFLKDGVEVQLRGRIADGKSIVNVQGDGLLWTKPLPGGEKKTSYETWLRTHHHPAGLELLDQYESEMR